MPRLSLGLGLLMQRDGSQEIGHATLSTRGGRGNYTMVRRKLQLQPTASGCLIFSRWHSESSLLLLMLRSSGKGQEEAHNNDSLPSQMYCSLACLLQ